MAKYIDPRPALFSGKCHYKFVSLNQTDCPWVNPAVAGIFRRFLEKINLIRALHRAQRRISRITL